MGKKLGELGREAKSSVVRVDSRRSGADKSTQIFADRWKRKFPSYFLRAPCIRNARLAGFGIINILFSGKNKFMTDREVRKLEGTIRAKMEDIKKQRVSVKDSGIGGLLNSLKKVDEALYDKILPEYKELLAKYNIFK